MNELARIERIRTQLDAIAPGEWSLCFDGDERDGGAFVEARGTAGELIPIVRFRREASPDEMEFVAGAPEAVRFLLDLVDRAIAKARRQAADARSDAKQPPAKDFAAEAAMKCQEPTFKAFLEACHGLERPLTDDRAAQKLRSLLGITSRKALNEDAAAAERWKRLRGEFQDWRKAR